ncbi:MAG: hypothetical protein IJJ50_05720 [Lachnospiraceae bacterium]|nr:hypothetical protein [Lachnospiraceae bacterium]
MNRFLYKLERKLGRYAVPNLTTVLIGCFIAGYIISAINSSMIGFMYLDPMYILKGQVWRIFTWIVVPPSSFDIFTLIMLLFYFSIGRTLERTWGDFRYNLFILGGMLISVITSFIMYGILRAVYNTPVSFGGAFSTYYICMSLFLAYAMTYPNMQVLLMFVIPIRVKWLGIIYGVYIVYDVFQYIRGFIASGNPGYIIMVVAILASVANFLIFFFTTRNYRKIDPREIRRKQQFKRSYEAGIRENKARKNGMGNSPFGGSSSGTPFGGTSNESGPYAGAGYPTHPVRHVQDTVQDGFDANGRPVYRPTATRHRCVICGRTEVTDPDLTFRYCSKCTGGKEYCQDHLFTHEHS